MYSATPPLRCLSINRARIQAHYQAVNEISIPGLTLAAEYDANGDGDYTDSGDVTLGNSRS
ncbi:hypothetical protein [Halococcus thailandensis]|uniref:hypothetical protein n=1 Tax=Halococcus thailandensis TaxID=335952 RepID=UPI0012681F37|nr:hypothetical protein [Halococcus thailandensis]